MTKSPLLAIVLAAGKGTRMKSSIPKVLHRIGGLSMLGHVLATAANAGAAEIAVVVGPDMDAAREEVARLAANARIFIQDQQFGTAHAVLAGRAAIAAHTGDVVVLYADTPLLRPGTLEALRRLLSDRTPIAVLGFRAADPTGYGRLLTDASGMLVAIREHKDASEAERAIDLCCSGIMAFRADTLLPLLDRIGNDNAQREYYLTDAVVFARSQDYGVAMMTCAEAEVLGINARDQLARAEAVFQNRSRQQAMSNGATLTAPETVYFSHDTVIGRDVAIEPNVFLGPGCVIEDEVEIKANCHLEGVRVRRGAHVGPFARLRPGADIGPDVHIGNFVEVKNVAMGRGAKANHLAYLGDGSVGEGANIGAGTIFCNYDGFKKHRTQVGAGAFVGSNTSLVAPVEIGRGAYVGSGSIITRNVPDDALALERGQQEIREGWATKFRRLMGQRAPSAK